jgi:hypothetical protein
MIKRVLSVATVVGLTSIALAGTATAGPGGFGSGGRLTFNDLIANANFVDGNGDFIGYVNVDRGAQSFRTRGGGVMEFNATVLSVGSPAGNGCFIIPDSAFNVANDLSSASVDVAASVPCPGQLVGGAAGGRPGLQTVVGFGPAGGGLTSVTVDMRWTGNGGLWEEHNSGTGHCGSYNGANQGTFDFEFAPASGTIDVLGEVSDPTAQIAHVTLDQVANGDATGVCNPFGF